MIELLIVFIHHNIPFRLEELDSICALLNISISYDRAAHDAVKDHTPFLFARFPSIDAAKRVVQRSLTIRVILDVWGHGRDYPELFAQIAETRQAETLEPHGDSFRFEVLRFGGSISFAEKIDRINRFADAMAHHGKVDLTSPARVYWLIEDFGLPDPKRGKKQLPDHVYFGLELGNSAHNAAAVDRYSLQKRKYLGTTSMRADLSFLVANQAKAFKGALVIDPFVGTGSLLIGCAHFGAVVVGSDIDAPVLRGFCKSPQVPAGANQDNANVFDNFRQYGILSQLGGLVIQDNAHTAWHAGAMFDAIVCDPPYGVRAGAKTIRPGSMPSKKKSKTVRPPTSPDTLEQAPDLKKQRQQNEAKEVDSLEIASSLSDDPSSSSSSSSSSSPSSILSDSPSSSSLDSESKGPSSSSESRKPFRIPRFIEYTFADVLVDLFNFALARLVVGGRLVFWVPATHHFHPAELPTHPSLRFIGASMEKLTRICARILVTMEKTAPFDPQVDPPIPPIPLETLVHLSFANYGYEYFGEESTRLKLVLPSDDSISSSTSSSSSPSSSSSSTSN